MDAHDVIANGSIINMGFRSAHSLDSPSDDPIRSREAHQVRVQIRSLVRVIYDSRLAWSLLIGFRVKDSKQKPLRQIEYVALGGRGSRNESVSNFYDHHLQ